MARSPHSRMTPLRVFEAKDFGVEGSDVVTDTAGLKAAVAAAEGEGGGTVHIEGGVCYAAETIDLPQNVWLDGDGAEVTTISSAVMSGPVIRHVQTELDIFGYGKRSGIRNLTVNGLTIGPTFLVPALVEATDAFGFTMENVLLQGGMVGFHGRAVDAWLENTTLNNVHFRTCQTALRFEANADAPIVPGFGRSFGFTHLRDLKINMNVPNGVGIDLGGPTGAEASYVGWDVNGTIYMDVDDVVGVKVRPAAHVYANVWNLAMDTFGSLERIAVVVDPGGEWRPTGYVGDGSQVYNIDGDLEVVQSAKGVVMKSPNGNRWRMGVSNAGATTWTAL